MIHYFYSLNAEQFYGIPRSYFYDNLQIDYTMKLLTFIPYIMILLSPIIIKKYFNKLKKLDSFAASIFPAFLVLSFWVNFCDSIIINTLHILVQDSIFVVSCVVILIIFLILYFFAFSTDFSEHKNNDKQKVEIINDKNDEIEVIKTKVNNNFSKFDVIIFIAIFIVLVSICIMLYNSTLFTPKNKINYEIFEVGQSKYNVIVGTYKDSVIIMEGMIEPSNNNSGSNLKITKYNYKIVSIEEKELEYCSFNLVSSE